jgi:hypothetical protein
MRILDGVGKLFILVAAIVIVVWLLLDDNYCNRPTPISGKPLKDAIIKALDSAEQGWKRREDSLKQVTQLINRKVDSFQILKSQADSRLKITSDRSAGLAAEVKRLRAAGQDDDALKQCDSLAEAVTGLRFDLVQQRWITDSLLQAKNNIIAITEDRVGEAIEFNRRMRGSLDSVSTLYDDLDRRYIKAARKAIKKYTLSLSLGYGIGTKAEPQPFVGVTIGRTLIRF